MKRLLLSTFIMVLLSSAILAQDILSKEEKTKAIAHLKSTELELLKTVKGLSEEQLHFKPSNDVWSIAECMEHIAISENNIFEIVEMTLQMDPDPALRSEVQMSDEQVLGLIETREQKVKTRPEFEPTAQFGGFAGSLEAFKKKRKSNLKYVKSSEDDLRNRYFDFPFGKIDAYQVILFMSGHTQRHTDQIKELMASNQFPNS